jgi:hypothetical protein
LSARPQPKKAPQAFPLGYVEDAFEVRTKLADFFNILPVDYGWDIEGRQASSGDMKEHRLLPLPPPGFL